MLGDEYLPLALGQLVAAGAGPPIASPTPHRDRRLALGAHTCDLARGRLLGAQLVQAENLPDLPGRFEPVSPMSITSRRIPAPRSRHRVRSAVRADPSASIAKEGPRALRDCRTKVATARRSASGSTRSPVVLTPTFRSRTRSTTSAAYWLARVQ